MSLRANMPEGTPDPYIAMLADSTRTLVATTIEWRLDHLRVAAGLARVVGAHDDTTGTPTRMVHCRNTACAPYGHFHTITDVEPS